MSDHELFNWAVIGMSLLLGLVFFLPVWWNDRKHRKHHHQQ